MGYSAVVLNLRYAKTSYINENETQEPLEQALSLAVGEV
jgi:hypothetical protein